MGGRIHWLEIKPQKSYHKRIVMGLFICKICVLTFLLNPMSQNKVETEIPVYQCDFCKKETLALQEVFSFGCIRILYPRRPVIEASALIIPKRHVELVEEMNEEEIIGTLKATKMLREIFEKIYEATAFNLFVNSGVAAGQHVPHVHFHFYGRSADEAANPFKILNDPKLYKDRPLVLPEELKNRIKVLQSYFKQTPG